MRISLINLVKKFKKDAAIVAVLNMLYAVLLAFWPLLTKFIIDNYIYKNDVDNFPKFIMLMLLFVVMISLTELSYCFMAGKFEKKGHSLFKKRNFFENAKTFRQVHGYAPSWLDGLKACSRHNVNQRIGCLEPLRYGR